MNKYRWVVYQCDFRLECPNCGGEVEIETKLSDQDISDNFYQDGDFVRCKNKNCGFEGYVSCDSETDAYISELDEE